MQTTSQRFDSLAQGHVNPFSWALRASFDKTFESGVTFFELDSSLLDGIDVLAPSDNNVVQEWDKYEYSNFTDRAVQLEWSREEDFPYSVNLAMADITLNNYDDLFTSGSGSPLEPNILPRRPFRILSGFGGENLPQFVGLSESTPKVDYDSKTASVHCVDFLSFIFNKPLDQTVMLVDVKTDEVLDYLFQLVGLTPSQYVLDEGFNQISFVYWEKGKKLGDAIRDLMQAEIGNLYMDELGIIRFKNRIKSSTSPVYTFDDSTVEEFTISDEESIINVVEIKANVRKVQPIQPVYTLSEPLLILSGASRQEFFTLQDPVTSLEDVTTYLANSQEDGQGTNLTANISIDDVDVFANAVKIIFSNSGPDAYITELELQGTPAKAIGPPLYLRAEDEASVAQYEERILTIENDFIQSRDAANSIALSIINYFKTFSNTVELTVKGNPALQTGDNIQVEVDGIDQVYTITKIVNIIERTKYTQRLTGKVFNIPNFFILSSDDTAMSLLNGEDVLAP